LLVVTVDLLPGGDPERRRTIGSLRIANASNLADISDYRIVAVQAANPLTGATAGIGSCEVIGHDRRQAIWSLLAKAAEAAARAEFDEL
jgi:hypothetical protein